MPIPVDRALILASPEKKFWTSSKSRYTRDDILELYLWWSTLPKSFEEKNKMIRKRDPKIQFNENDHSNNAYQMTIERYKTTVNHIKETFKAFLEEEEHFKKLMLANQAPDKHLAAFLALYEIKAIVDAKKQPVEFLEDAVKAQNTKEIESITSFILSNYPTAFDPDTMMNELTPSQKQQFARTVAPLIFNHPNARRISDATFLKVCKAAKFDSNKSPLKHLKRPWLKNIVLRIYSWLAEKIAGYSINALVLTPTLAEKIQEPTTATSFEYTPSDPENVKAPAPTIEIFPATEEKKQPPLNSSTYLGTDPKTLAFFINEKKRLKVERFNDPNWRKRIIETALSESTIYIEEDTEKNDHEFVKIQSRNKSADYYFIDPKETVGKGAHGAVCKAYKINAESGELDIEHPFIVKKIPAEKTTPQKITNEVAATKILGRDTSYVKIKKYQEKDYYFLFSTFKPGATLLTTGEPLTNLTLLDRIDVIIELLKQLSTLHNAGYVHGDVNRNNILIHKDPKTGSTTAHLIDCGESQKVPVRTNTDPNNILFHAPGRKITELSAPPEYASRSRKKDTSRIGLKSDIFSMAAHVIQLLGGKDPFLIRNEFKALLIKYKNNRNSMSQKEQEKINRLFKEAPMLADQPFDTAGLLSDTGLPRKLVPNVTQSINHMQNRNYRERPTVDQCLQFFTAFRDKIAALQQQNERAQTTPRAVAAVPPPAPATASQLEEENDDGAGVALSDDHSVAGSDDYRYFDNDTENDDAILMDSFGSQYGAQLPTDVAAAETVAVEAKAAEAKAAEAKAAEELPPSAQTTTVAAAAETVAAEAKSAASPVVGEQPVAVARTATVEAAAGLESPPVSIRRTRSNSLPSQTSHNPRPFRRPSLDASKVVGSPPDNNSFLSISSIFSSPQSPKERPPLDKTGAPLSPILRRGSIGFDYSDRTDITSFSDNTGITSFSSSRRTSISSFSSSD